MLKRTPPGRKNEASPLDTPTKAAPPSIVIPEGYTLHTESSSHILISSKDEAFLNPVQEFNRDLSVACIRVWSEVVNNEKEAKWKERRAQRDAEANGGKESEKKVQSADGVGDQAAEQVTGTGEDMESKTVAEDEQAGQQASVEDVPMDTSGALAESKVREVMCLFFYRPYKFVLLEPLSATGLRSIRYAKEIPLVRFVIANDLSESAAAAMRRNVELNGLGPTPTVEASEDNDNVASTPTTTEDQAKRPSLGKVRVNEGDACALMYNHRTEKTRVDVVDLDPYGTAAPFIDAAVQAVNDGGLLCVTCTDLAVLATTNYPEKCYANYGGIPVKAEYCHEAALRLILNSIATAASRYGRYIEPILSLSVDFYARLFVRIHTGPVEVKKLASQTSMYYICQGCQSFHAQKLGRTVERTNERRGTTSYSYKTHSGPPVPSECSECGFNLHVAGPMWSGPLHNPEFLSRVLKHVDKNESKYATFPRMRGVLTVAKEELDVPFYFTPGRIAGTFHCTTPSFEEVGAALLHAGHKISRSHATPGSVKTTASREEIYDVFRNWVKKNPVRMDRVSDNSPAHRLLSKEPKQPANFKRHPGTYTPSSQVKIIRYQQNMPNWGPGSRARSGVKRKRDQEEP
ncbi:tRNA methyltransferase [Phlebopus sp. FC_14]|nr:tRNA methyltransferase [Phlebopus sp. FC_14]